MKRRSPKHFLNDIWEEIMTTEGSAETVARSFAIGSLLSLTPTFGLGFLIGVTLLIFIPTLHKPALLSAFALWNPITQIPVYSLGIFIGTLIFHDLPVVMYDITLWDQVVHITRRVIIGTLIVAVGITIVSYVLVFASIRKAKGKPVFHV